MKQVGVAIWFHMIGVNWDAAFAQSDAYFTEYAAKGITKALSSAIQFMCVALVEPIQWPSGKLRKKATDGACNLRNFFKPTFQVLRRRLCPCYRLPLG